MAYVAHLIEPKLLADKTSSTLKRICQSWTKLDEYQYVAHHAEALKSSCPICILKE